MIRHCRYFAALLRAKKFLEDLQWVDLEVHYLPPSAADSDGKPVVDEQERHVRVLLLLLLGAYQILNTPFLCASQSLS